MNKPKYNKILALLKEIITGTEYENHVFSVGGCERDNKIAKEIKDIDIVIDIPNGGINFALWLYENGHTVYEPVVYPHFGTAMFKLKKFPDEEIEAVQTRKECYRDIDTRNPETAYGTLEEDCTRRDFTINAFYRNITTGEVLDLTGKSEADLKNHIIRTCGDPSIIFDEDPLRILRMVRFAARFDFNIAPEAFEYAKKMVDRLSIISIERIHDEFMQMCSYDSLEKFNRALALLWDLKAMKFVLPYLSTLTYPERFEVYNRVSYVFNLVKTPETVFAALLYYCDDAENEMRGLRCTNDFIKNVLFYIKESKEFYKSFKDIETYDENENFLFKKLMYKCKSREKLIGVLSVGPDEVTNYFFAPNFIPDYTTFGVIEKDNLMYYEYQLPVDGNDVMNIAGIEPSAKVKEILDKLFNFAVINPDQSDRESVLNYLKYLVKDGLI